MRVNKAIENMDPSLDYALILKKENIFYLTGYFPTAFAVLVLCDTPYLAVSEMDAILAENHDIDVRVVKKFNKELNFKGVVGVEKKYTTMSFVEKFLNGCEIMDLLTIDEMRQIKDPSEVELIKKAINVTENVLENTAIMGRTEREAASQIGYSISKTCDSAFDIIVASGKNSSVQHHTPTDGKIDESGPVIIDLGSRYEHYNCDMTRTFSWAPSEKFKDVYQAVVEAEKTGIAQIRAGAPISVCDDAIRSVLRKHGLEKYFIHSSGHGVGLDVHEAPRISKDSKDVFKKGMVVSIEPGVYIPSWGGVRIEDVVHVGKQPKTLTRFPMLNL